MRLEDCWAKTTQDGSRGMSVREHCRIVGNVALALRARLPQCVLRLLPQYGASVAACHDVGKVSPGFQKRIAPQQVASSDPELARRALASFSVRHAEIGQAAVNRLIAGRFRISAPAAVVGAHHGSWCYGGPRSDVIAEYGDETWSGERRRLIDELLTEFGPLANEDLPPALIGVLAGFVTVSDWIGSDEAFFPAAGLPADADLARQAGTAVAGSGWHVPQFRPGLSFKEVFGGRKPFPVQESFIEAVAGPGLYVLEAPMGCGKTEAALYAAYKLMVDGHNAGLYFGLPTRLTSDKIHERVEAFLSNVCSDRAYARLAHGMAWLKEFERGGKGFGPYGQYDCTRVKEDEEPDSSWFHPAKRALLWPFAVGTIDQALLSVVRVKHHFVRTFGLAGKVVILDEVHSYDVYTGSLIETLVSQLLELDCTVIVLSATLTGERRGRLAGESAGGSAQQYPLITRRADGRVQTRSATPPAGREYGVVLADLAPQAVAERANLLAERGACVLCIANTVGLAQTWYDAVNAERAGDYEVGLLHSKFPAFRREQLEAIWLERLGRNSAERPNGCVLVATQVVEQSVDIDADILITELAPMDMLLQRMGRVWRHDETVRPPGLKPEACIVCGDVSAAADAEDLLSAMGRPSCFVYQPYVLWHTWRVLRERISIVIPDHIRGLIEATYAESACEEPDFVAELKNELEAWRDRLRQYAQASLATVAAMPWVQDEEAVTTRYSDRPNQDVLLVQSVETDGREALVHLLDVGPPLRLHAERRCFEATRRLHRQVVTVPRHAIADLASADRATWLRQHFHAALPIWELRNEFGPLTMAGRETGYTYDTWRGLRRLESTQSAPQPFDEYEEENFPEVVE